MKKETTGGRISVIFCDCGGVLPQAIDVKRLAEGMKNAGQFNATLEVASRLCDPGRCAQALKRALKDKPSGLVVAACEREKYAALLSGTLKKLKFNEGLVAAVNLREHCALVHPARKDATDKAMRLLISAVSRVSRQEPIRSVNRRMRPEVAVLGGGMAGIRTVLQLAKLGRRVTLVHSAPQLGGTAALMAPFFGYLRGDSRQGAREMKEELGNSIAAVSREKNIRVISAAEVRSIEGTAGNFTTRVSAGLRDLAIETGAIVLAVDSFSAFPFQKAGIPKHAGIIDLQALASMLARNETLPARIAILMDLSGEQTRAVNALAFGAAELLAAQMKKDVTVYCHHARVAAAGIEELYQRARAAGVVFERSDKSPVLSAGDGCVHVRGAADLPAESGVFDLAVIADSVAGEGVVEMARKAGIRPGPEGWLQYDNVWLIPALSTRSGIYVVGASRGNNDFREAFNDASGAASSIDALLGSGRVTVAADQAAVAVDKCVLCLTCVRSCPHAALSISPISPGNGSKPQVAVSESACKRCGICAALCPARAIQLPRFTDSQAAMELEGAGPVTVFACQNSAWRAATAAGAGLQHYGADVQVIPVPCAGRTDSAMILRALEKGSRKVILLGCHREACRYLAGADYAARRIDALRKKLEQAGHDGKSLAVGNMAEFETWRFLEYVKEEITHP